MVMMTIEEVLALPDKPEGFYHFCPDCSRWWTHIACEWGSHLDGTAGLSPCRVCRGSPMGDHTYADGAPATSSNSYIDGAW